MSEEQQEQFVFYLCPDCTSLLDHWTVHKTYYKRILSIIDINDKEIESETTVYDEDIEIEKYECPACGWESDGNDSKPEEFKIAITRNLEIIPIGKYWQEDPDNLLLTERNRIINQFLEKVGDQLVGDR